MSGLVRAGISNRGKPSKASASSKIGLRGSVNDRTLSRSGLNRNSGVGEGRNPSASGDGARDGGRLLRLTGLPGDLREYGGVQTGESPRSALSEVLGEHALPSTLDSSSSSATALVEGVPGFSTSCEGPAAAIDD